MAKRLTVREKCLKEIKRLDSKIKNPEECHSAIFLLTASQVGPKLRAITKESGLAPAQVRQFFARAKQQKIFRNGKIACEWFDENGGIAFWADTLVIDEMLARA
jgi:hypothetical protein